MNPFKPHLQRSVDKTWDYYFQPDWGEQARAREGRVARQDVVAWAHAAGVPAEVLLDVEIALGEAVSNVVRHSNAMSMRVSAEMSPCLLVVTVEDTGRGFVLAALPDPDDSWEHGRGIPLLRYLCTRLDIESRPGRTVVRMVKAWRAR